MGEEDEKKEKITKKEKRAEGSRVEKVMDKAKSQSVPFSPEKKIENTNPKSRSLLHFLSRVPSSPYPLLPKHANKKQHLSRGGKVFSDRR